MTQTQSKSDPNRPGFVNWKRSADSKAKEIERRTLEVSKQVVRVKLTGVGNEAMIYRQNRKGLRHQDLTDRELAMLGTDEAGYFLAQWSDETISWHLLKRVHNVVW